MAERKRPRDHANPRLTIEIYQQDAELVHRLRVAALEAKTTLREWLLEAGRQRLTREATSGDDGQAAAVDQGRA